MITNQRDLHWQFWQEHPYLTHLHKRTVKMGDHKDYPADVRMAFVTWLDDLSKTGEVSQELAYRATL